jgi:hypothetical protein
MERVHERDDFAALEEVRVRMRAAKVENECPDTTWEGRKRGLTRAPFRQARRGSSTPFLSQ